jgi:hypothetical protein
MKRVDEERALALADAEPLFLSVIVGNAQMGGNYVEITRSDGAKLPIAKAAEITNLFVGTGATLRGGSLLVRTAVVDINPHTDWTIVTHRLKTGNSPGTDESFTCEADTKTPGSDGIVLYTITYHIA